MTIAGHGTSVALEPEFWQALQEIARTRSLSLPALLAEIDAHRAETGLASAARVYALTYFRELSAPDEKMS